MRKKHRKNTTFVIEFYNFKIHGLVSLFKFILLLPARHHKIDPLQPDNSKNSRPIK